MVLPSAQGQTHELVDSLDWNSYYSIAMLILSESFFAVLQVMPIHSSQMPCKGSWLKHGC